MDGIDELMVFRMCSSESEEIDLSFIEIDVTAHQSVEPEIADGELPA